MENFLSWLADTWGREFAGGVVGGGAVTAIGFSVMRQWLAVRLREGIKSEYDMRLEGFRSDLAQKANERVAELQTTLALAASAKTVAFTNIYERRIDAVKAIYRSLAPLNERLNEYVGINHSSLHEPLHGQVIDAIGAFDPVYFEHVIFLPKEMADRLKSLRLHHRTLTNMFHNHVQEQTGWLASPSHLEVLKLLNEDVNASMKALESAMRGLLDKDAIAIQEQK